MKDHHFPKVRCYIPQTYNDGQPVDPALFDFFEDVFFAAADAWSNPGLVRGACLGLDGGCQLDTSRIYEIAIAAPHVPRIIRIIYAISRLLQQKTVYYEIDRNTEVHIEPVLPRTPVHIRADRVNGAARNGKAATPLPSEER